MSVPSQVIVEVCFAFYYYHFTDLIIYFGDLKWVTSHICSKEKNKYFSILKNLWHWNFILCLIVRFFRVGGLNVSTPPVRVS